MTLFQTLALVGIFFIVLSSLLAARAMKELRVEMSQSNGLLKALLTTMRDRL